MKKNERTFAKIGNADHGGCTSFHAGKAPSGKYFLSGFGQAAEFLTFGTAIDRAWPDYTDPIPLLPQDVVNNMRPLYEELARRGTSVEKFRLEKGSSQIRPRRAGLSAGHLAEQRLGDRKSFT